MFAVVLGEVDSWWLFEADEAESKPCLCNVARVPILFCFFLVCLLVYLFVCLVVCLCLCLCAVRSLVVLSVHVCMVVRAHASQLLVNRALFATKNSEFTFCQQVPLVTLLEVITCAAQCDLQAAENLGCSFWPGLQEEEERLSSDSYSLPG